MLLDPRDWSLASRIDDVLPALLARRSPTARRPRRTARRSSSPAGRTRPSPARSPSCRRCAPGSPPPSRRSSCAPRSRARIRSRSGARSRSRRARATASIYDSMRELARREPTFALHVHVAVPDAESAVRALRGLRVHVPLLLALAANSPFWQGRDTGLASARVPIFGTFPRVGIPRRFGSYARVRRGDRRAAALRGVPRADVPVVGRAPAAPVRHDRGADHGRADARRPTTPRSPRSCSARCGSRRPRATPTRRSRAGPRCSTRTASWPRATGCGRTSSTRRHGPRRPARDVLDELLAACAPHAAELGCEAELAALPASPTSPATTASACSPACTRAIRSGPGSACSSPRWRTTSPPGSQPAVAWPSGSPPRARASRSCGFCA